jgi:uncharacterized protein with PIN domain
MTEFKNMQRCESCGNEFKYGYHNYDGQFIKTYQILVCSVCYETNWDGWHPNHEKKILQKLKENNSPIPERNTNGYLPRGY